MSIVQYLEAPGPDPEYAEKLMLYGQFVGRWDIAATWIKAGGERSHASGEWHFSWILGGRGIQDVLFRKNASPRTYGTTIRCYDSESDLWHVAWMQPYGREFVHLIGRQIGDRIVQEGTAADPVRRERWSFTEIRRNSFLWLGEASCDGGVTWVLKQEMRGNRIGG
jgi:hypothetical protein